MSKLSSMKIAKINIFLSVLQSRIICIWVQFLFLVWSLHKNILDRNEEKIKKIDVAEPHYFYAAPAP
jgi:hypothetical protein